MEGKTLKFPTQASALMKNGEFWESLSIEEKEKLVIKAYEDEVIKTIDDFNKGNLSREELLSELFDFVHSVDSLRQGE